jgi:hypothetical protein
MLTITEHQLARLAIQSHLERVKMFLLDRTDNPRLRSLLADEVSCSSVCSASVKPQADESEHDLAVRISFALAASTRDRNSEGLLVVEDESDRIVRMKLLLEDWNIVRFSDFDMRI